MGGCGYCVPALHVAFPCLFPWKAEPIQYDFPFPDMPSVWANTSIIQQVSGRQNVERKDIMTFILIALMWFFICHGMCEESNNENEVFIVTK